MIGPGDAAVADLGAVEAAHAGDAEARGGQEHLFGVRRVEEIDVAFNCRNGELAREIERHLAADAGKDVTFARGIELALADHKDVAAHPLGEISVDVEQHRPALGIVRFHRLLRDDHVQVVVRLRARAEHVRRDAALRGRPHVETVAELTRARLERQRRAFHNYVRTAVLGHFIPDRIGPQEMIEVSEQIVARNEHLRGVAGDWWIGQRVSRGIDPTAPGTLNTAEGNDTISGTGESGGIYNTGTLNTAEGNDIITATAEGRRHLQHRHVEYGRG